MRLVIMNLIQGEQEEKRNKLCKSLRSGVLRLLRKFRTGFTWLDDGKIEI